MEQKRISAEPVSSTNITPYGELFNTDTAQPAFDSDIFSFWNDASVGDVDAAPVSFGMVVTKPGAPRVPALERHLRTTETLVPIDADITLVLGVPTEGPLPDPTTVRALRVPRGAGVTLHKGTWHYVPLIAENKPARTLVVFRQGTPADDLEIKELGTELGFEYVIS